MNIVDLDQDSWSTDTEIFINVVLLTDVKNMELLKKELKRIWEEN